MLQKFFHLLFFRLMGWQEHVTVERPARCIICVAPHTSNWDFIIAKLYYFALGRRAGFLMKKEWFVGPLGAMFRAMDGVPVERSRHTSLTDQLAERARESERFELALTPEGTRSRVTTWKRGFYYIALKADLPILLYAIDYKRRTITCTLALRPTGDVDADMRRIMDYYRPCEGKHPERFCVEEIPAAKG